MPETNKTPLAIIIQKKKGKVLPKEFKILKEKELKDLRNLHVDRRIREAQEEQNTRERIMLLRLNKKKRRKNKK